ncbi:hypothetical protein ABFS83_10G086300 [Erythranthe nasuta]
MGCVSSKMVAKEIEQENLYRRSTEYTHHFVSLTSTTYGALNLDGGEKQAPPPLPPPEKENQEAEEVKKITQPTAEVKSKTSPPREDQPSEIINTWELMEGLEDGGPGSVQSKKSPKSRLFLRGFSDMDPRSPLKFLNQMGSPKKVKKVGGKENRGRINGGTKSLDNSPKTVFKECNVLKDNTVRKPSPRLWASIRGSPNVKRCDSGIDFSKRRSLGPLFCTEDEIKKSGSMNPSNAAVPDLDSYKKKCPPGGETAVVIYTTTLRGIRKTFEDCNVARSVIESHGVQMFERDVSMHSGYKEELRGLMSSKEVRVPLVFVKGRLIGGADELVKLDEEGKLGILLDGIPRAAAASCGGCAGIRFLMCVNCNGSCKILGEDGKKSVKCNKCNENGLIQCPICC